MMKQSDIAMVILVASLTLVVSFVVGGRLINSPSNRSTEVERVVSISPDFPSPDTEKVFSANAINPTQLIQIGNTNTNKPFETE